MLSQYLPVLFQGILAAGFAALLLTLTHLMGPNRKNAVKLAPFECGVDLLDQAHHRFSVKFYLVAMLFILFDIETIFFYPWAVILRELGWLGILAVVSFFVVLGVGYLYARARGALEWR